MESQRIWTIGHSTQTIQVFLDLLSHFEIEILADIRRFPMSRRYPHFNRNLLSAALTQNHIRYVHLETLGGRRKPQPLSANTGWRVASFRGYADYMETDEFRKSVADLEQMALSGNVAFMCSEAVWWSCHRALVSDYLKHKGWEVYHIMGKKNPEEHPYTSPARIENNKLVYSNVNELDFGNGD